MDITATEFQKLMADVEQEFGKFLAKAESVEASASEVTVLSKSEDEGKEEPKKEDEEKKEDPKPESAPEKTDEAPKQEAQQEEKAPEEQPAEQQEQPQGEEEGHGYDDEDMAHMHEMYGSMSKQELKAHHDSVRAALDKCMGMDKSDLQPAPAPEAAPMAKSESIEIPASIVTPELELIKSELSAKTAEHEELKKSFGVLTQLLEKLVKKPAPQAKAIISVETIAKSEDLKPEGKALSEVEISKILKVKTQDQSLAKSDRDLIDAYVLRGTSVQTINHLLK